MGIDRANYEGKVFNRNIGKKLNFKKIKHVNEMTQQKRVCKKVFFHRQKYFGYDKYIQGNLMEEQFFI